MIQRRACNSPVPKPMISSFQAVSILGEEVFRFQMTLYPDATEGEAYADVSKVDGRLSLKVGCIQIVYVHKFFMSLLVSVCFSMCLFLIGT